MKMVGTADWHAGIHTDDVNGSRAKELEVAVDLMAAEDPDLLLIAGDLFHHNHPSVDTILFVRRQLAKFRNALLIPGNHDFSYTGSSPVLLLDAENVLVKTTCGIVGSPIGDIPILCIPPTGDPETMLDGLTDDDFKCADLIMGHWAPVVSQLAVGIERTFFAPDAWMPKLPDSAYGKRLFLGHYHGYTDYSMHPVSSPGSPLRLDFGDDPSRAKGFIVMEWDRNDGFSERRFVEIPSRDYVTIDYKNGMQFLNSIQTAVVRLRVPERTDVGRIVTKLYDAGAFHVRPPETIRTTRRPRSEEIKKGMPHADAVKTYCKMHEISAPVQKRAVDILQGGIQ